MDFLDQRDQDEVQLFFVPSYACNFNCGYCYQSEYESKAGIASSEVIGAFFRYVDTEFLSRRKYLTIFGGEPLLNSSASQDALRQLITGAFERELEVAIVTNGYNLIEQLSIIEGASTSNGMRIYLSSYTFMVSGNGYGENSIM